jgi:hypothetical protein
MNSKHWRISSIMKNLTKRRRRRGAKCDYCGRRFTPPKRGRPPRFCCASHRQLAFVARRASDSIPLRLVMQDLNGIRRKHEIRRELIGLLREFGVELGPPPAPTPSRRKFQVITGGKSDQLRPPKAPDAEPDCHGCGAASRSSRPAPATADQPPEPSVEGQEGRTRPDQA